MKITRDLCGFCGACLSQRDAAFPEGSRRIAVVSKEKDCVVAYRCPDCLAQEPRPLANVLAVADPSAFKEVP